MVTPRRMRATIVYRRSSFRRSGIAGAASAEIQTSTASVGNATLDGMTAAT
jgi:hypothetical protein